jgi:hypothetical protein
MKSMLTFAHQKATVFLAWVWRAEHLSVMPAGPSAA